MTTAPPRPAPWTEAVCRLAYRNLTGVERDQYSGDLATHRRTCPTSPDGDAV